LCFTLYSEIFLKLEIINFKFAISISGADLDIRLSSGTFDLIQITPEDNQRVVAIILTLETYVELGK
jgi:hypothetical protein